MLAIITFIIVFGLIVLVHEFGHYYFAKKSGILVRQFSIGMGPKLISYTRNHTLYTIRLLPVGGYVMMAGAEDDDEDIKPGTILGLKLNSNGKVVKIDNSKNNNDSELVPVQVTKCDLVKDLYIEGYENGNEDSLKKYTVDHDATIVDESNNEMQIAPLDVQFNSASLWHRFITNLAGPMNNLLFGIIVFIISSFLMGGPVNNNNRLGEVVPHSIAAKSGLKSGDEIVKVGNQKTNNWNQLAQTISTKPGKKIKVIYKDKNNKPHQTTVTPKVVKQNGKKIGQIGIMPARKSDFGSELKYGFDTAFGSMGLIFNALKNMVTNGFNLNQLGGPVAIYSQTSQVAAMGFKEVVFFVGWLSINLGIMNLLPIPALDGGKLLLNIIEAIRGKPISQRTEMVITMIGVGLLVALMIAVTWNDIMRFFIK